MYEGGLLVPACAVWPGVIPGNTTTSVRCSTVDYFATIAKLVGYRFRSKDDRPLDGIDSDAGDSGITPRIDRRICSLAIGD